MLAIIHTNGSGGLAVTPVGFRLRMLNPGNGNDSFHAAKVSMSVLPLRRVPHQSTLRIPLYVPDVSFRRGRREPQK